MRDRADRGDRQALGCDRGAHRRRPVGDPVHPEVGPKGEVSAGRSLHVDPRCACAAAGIDGGLVLRRGVRRRG